MRLTPCCAGRRLRLHPSLSFRRAAQASALPGHRHYPSVAPSLACIRAASASTQPLPLRCACLLVAPASALRPPLRPARPCTPSTSPPRPSMHAALRCPARGTVFHERPSVPVAFMCGAHASAPLPLAHLACWRAAHIARPCSRRRTASVLLRTLSRLDFRSKIFQKSELFHKSLYTQPPVLVMEMEQI